MYRRDINSGDGRNNITKCTGKIVVIASGTSPRRPRIGMTANAYSDCEDDRPRRVEQVQNERQILFLRYDDAMMTFALFRIILSKGRIYIYIKKKTRNIEKRTAVQSYIFTWTENTVQYTICFTNRVIDF